MQNCMDTTHSYYAHIQRRGVDMYTNMGVFIWKMSRVRPKNQQMVFPVNSELEGKTKLSTGYLSLFFFFSC